MSGWGGSKVELYPNGIIGIRFAWIKHEANELKPGLYSMDQTAAAISSMCK
jgi:hypothetical protein